MLNENQLNFIQKVKKIYYKIGSIKCAAFLAEQVVFNGHGFNHLLRKGRKFRERSEQEMRFGLLPDVIKTIEIQKIVNEYRTSTVDNSHAHFWELKGKTENGKSFYVVLRKKNNGHLHFFSVYDE